MPLGEHPKGIAASAISRISLRSLSAVAREVGEHAASKDGGPGEHAS